MNYNLNNLNRYYTEPSKISPKDDLKEKVKTFLYKLDKYLYGDLTDEIKREFGIFNGVCAYGVKIGNKAESMYSEMIGLVSKYLYVIKVGYSSESEILAEIKKDISKANKLRKSLNVLINKSRNKYQVEEIEFDVLENE